ncbi:MAG: UDP-3-O-(3-hydroxymyristoyl)glucosamine N-acyltransferase [Planctomycetota bacterium]|nr:UDP-3-O-(3-hydroxymyristoyl)glucosamine N-acyltransferase [Planctomycetota bacterium]MDI6788661.1 UDP-3-O-(3-hydroxymyristoyl)glucosamine N-acyltransferase [Planctomycetota bacterium]
MKREKIQPTTGSLAKLVQGKIISGKSDTFIKNFGSIDRAQSDEITFLANKKYLPLLKDTKASAVLSPDIPEIKWLSVPPDLTVILVDNPDLAFSKVVEYFLPSEKTFPAGIHKKALIAGGVKLGKKVSVHAFAVIEKGTVIADGTIIYPNVYIGSSAKIGKNCLIYPNVVIREQSVIGDNVIIHSGTVIGSDGFGYTMAQGKRVKIPQRGNVIIEDDVEIGANVTIDRARFGSTIIRKGVKIDNLVHIAHNVEIGENSLLIAQVVIAGSARIGKNVILAGQSGVDGHIQIGDNVKVGAKAGVMKNIPPNSMVAGFPARPYRQHLKELSLLNKLPELIKRLKH